MSFANNFQVLEKRGYQTFELINYGVQGHVYKACKGGRDYTIKVVSLFANENQTAKNKKIESDLCIDVKRELNILTKLRHPSCLRVEECFQTRTKVYIVMPFLVGGTLGSAIKERSLLCEWNVKIWFPPIVCSLSKLTQRYLHQHKIALRNLTLDSVILDEFDNPLLDFGFAQFIQSDGLACETFWGTRSFSAPYVIKSIAHDALKSDIWSLGVMLFAMFNKKLPFNSNDDSERMFEKMVNRNYKLAEQVEVSISKEAKELIHLMLEPSEKKRPNIETVANHQWMPSILLEADYVIDQIAKTHSGGEL